MSQPHSAVREGDATAGTAYGYQWWVTEVTGYDAAFALGYGGQYIDVVPDLDLVVVAAVARRVPAGELRSPRPIIEELIVPAALQWPIRTPADHRARDASHSAGFEPARGIERWVPESRAAFAPWYALRPFTRRLSYWRPTTNSGTGAR